MSNAPVSIEQLHDIVLPNAPSLFPLATGWWIIITITGVVFALILKKVLAYVAFWRIKRLAIKHLAHCQNTNELNQLLKKVAIHYFSTHQIAPMTGPHWQQFLSYNLKSQYHDDLTKSIAALYRPDSEDNFQVYQHIAQHWLKGLNRRAINETPHVII